MSHSPSRVVGVIPARYGSTRLPGKALLPIAGVPMIQRVYERARQASVLDALYVATDDARIAATVASFGGEAILTSPTHPSGTDRIAEAMAGIDAEIVVNLQGDQPFLDPRMIDEAVQPLRDDPALEMATVMHAIHRPEDLADPGVVKVVVDRFGDALYFSRARIPFPRHDDAHGVFEHVGLYVYRRAFLLRFAQLPPTPLERAEALEQLRALEHGYKIRVVETRDPDHAFTGFSIDTPEDLRRAEAMLRERDLTPQPLQTPPSRVRNERPGEGAGG